MKIIVAITFALLTLSVCLAFPSQNNQRETAPPAVNAFWIKFQSAVAKNDREAVASMARFPLEMPYGVRSIRSKAQLMKNYGKIFDAPTRKCFAEARPEFDEAQKGKFYIGCGEAMMYWFGLVRGEYKFLAVDNINE